ncbi:MAG: hypothetical protein JW940_00695 [Polyangiaceae bacterium]|nr:hypothetical protein [Polyangiaceae bacterium]
MTSFYDWLAKQKRLRTPLGDLARAAARDRDFPREVASLEALLDYVRTSSKGSAQAVVVARSAYQAYERSERPPPK